MQTPGRDESAGARPMTIGALPWYPILIAALYVCNLWIESGVSVMAVWRSLAVAVIGSVVLIGLFRVATRRVHVAGAAALVVFAILISRGPLYVLGVLLLAVAIPLALLLWGRIRREPLSWPRFTHALNLFSALLLVVVLSGGVLRGTYAAIPADLQQGSPELDPRDAAEAAATPNVYILMLDGYPRADSVTRLFGDDNRPFLDALGERGFDVAERSQSNYMFTQLTLTSMLHMSAIPEIDELRPAVEGAAAANPLMRITLNDNPVFDFMRAKGYRVVTSSPGYEHVTLRYSDVYLDDGQLNEFEYHLLRFTTLQSLVNLAAPNFFADQHRDRVRSGFDHFQQVVTSDGPPTLAFIHLPSPHLPVVFDAAGGRSNLPPSEDIYRWDTIDGETREAYGEQLAYVNAEVLRLVDLAMESSQDGDGPIIIVMSDHGAAPRPAVFEGEGTPEHYANFFAAHTPEAEGLFPEDTSPVNVFPVLFNRYFGGSFAEQPNGPYPWLAIK